MKTAANLTFLVSLVLPSLSAASAAGELKLASSGPREAAVELPGGQAKLTLVKGWGRTVDPKPDGTAWKAEGDKLPAIVAKAGEDWVELAIPAKLDKDDRIRIYRFDLTMPDAGGWQDADGARTFLRRGPKWQSVAELLVKRQPLPTRWAWPVAPGLTGLYEKTASLYGMSAHDIWTGFGSEYFAGVADPLNTVDVSAVARTDGAGRVLAVVAERAMAAGWEGGRLSLCAVLRDGRAGRESLIRLRLYCGQGQVEQLAGKWETIQ